MPGAVIAVLAALVAACFTRVYTAGSASSLLLGAAFLSVLVGMSLRPLAGWLVGPFSVVLLGGYTLLAVHVTSRADLDGPLLSAYTNAAGNALPQLLTAAVPMEATPATIGVPVVVVWLSGLLGTELACRSGRLALGMVPPTVAYVGALVLAGPHIRPVLWAPLVYAAVCVLGLRTRAWRLGGAVAGVVVPFAAVALVGPVVFAGVEARPGDPRTAVTPPREDVTDTNPLVRISGWAANPNQRLLDADLSADQRIRLAVLSEYDGVTWKVGADYRDAGGVLPRLSGAEVGSSGAPVVVRQSYTVAGLDGGLVPAVSAPTRVHNLRVAFDGVTGTLYRQQGLTPGLEYMVESRFVRPDTNVLPIADVPSGPAVARYLNVGGPAPAELAGIAEHVAKENPGSYEKAYALQLFLAEHFAFDPAAPSGHALANLRFFLGESTDAGGRRGTSEQFAASYAVLARLMGLPSRVVVGFTGRAGKHPVLASDALAWPEILFQDVGWVAFDPMPKGSTPRALEEEYTPPSPTPSPTVTPPSVRPPPVMSEPPHPVVARSQSGGGSRLLAVFGGGFLALTVLVLLTVVFLRRVRTYRRLKVGDPAQRVLGGWREVREALMLAGHPVHTHLTVTEIAAMVGSIVGGGGAPPLDQLAAAVNTVGFAPDATSATVAEAATAQAQDFVRAVRAQCPWWRRLLWSINPVPLLWRSASRRPAMARHVGMSGHPGCVRRDSTPDLHGLVRHGSVPDPREPLRGEAFSRSNT